MAEISTMIERTKVKNKKKKKTGTKLREKGFQKNFQIIMPFFS
jgi:hypothetical protein